MHEHVEQAYNAFYLATGSLEEIGTELGLCQEGEPPNKEGRSFCGRVCNSLKMGPHHPNTYKSMSPVQPFSDVGSHVQ